jgi:hypothetical protein
MRWLKRITLRGNMTRRKNTIILWEKTKLKITNLKEYIKTKLL